MVRFAVVVESRSVRNLTMREIDTTSLVCAKSVDTGLRLVLCSQITYRNKTELIVD